MLVFLWFNFLVVLVSLLRVSRIKVLFGLFCRYSVFIFFLSFWIIFFFDVFFKDKIFFFKVVLILCFFFFEGFVVFKGIGVLFFFVDVLVLGF